MEFENKIIRNNGFLKFAAFNIKNQTSPNKSKLWVEFKNRPKLPFRAVKAAGLNYLTFHDLRHCAINKLSLTGNDNYLIKQISGHKTDIAFQRYNLVTEEEIHRIKWLDKKEDNSGTMDTYMDTKAISWCVI